MRDLITDDADTKHLYCLIIGFMPQFLDLFHYLQAKSQYYPLIEAKKVKDDLIDKICEQSKYNFHI